MLREHVNPQVASGLEDLSITIRIGILWKTPEVYIIVERVSRCLLQLRLHSLC